MSKGTCPPKSFKEAALRCLPEDFYSLLYGVGIVVGVIDFLCTGNTLLLITFLGVTTGQKSLPEVKALLPERKHLPENVEHHSH